MLKLAFVVWLMLPLAAGAYHWGPGQDQLRLDQAGELLDQAGHAVDSAQQFDSASNDLAAQAEWALAAQYYGEALTLLPAERVAERRRVSVELAKSQMNCSKLPLANASLRGLVSELAADAQADQVVLADARRSLASSEYYMTWLARLEGKSREEWEPRIESARQIYKLLAEQSLACNDEAALQRDQHDLEAAIHLARMDLTELQGLPLPSQ